MSCAVLIDEMRHNDGRDEWHVMLIEDKIREWSHAEIIANYDAWFDKTKSAYELLEQAYYDKHGLSELTEINWQYLDSEQAAQFMAETITTNKGADTALDTSWLNFHTNEVLNNE